MLVQDLKVEISAPTQHYLQRKLAIVAGDLVTLITYCAAYNKYKK